MASKENSEYEGRYFWKEVVTEFGYSEKIKADNVELTDYYQQNIREVEIKVAREFTKNPNAEYPTYWDEGMQLPDYACACDYCYIYYSIKQRILRDEYGIEYLSFRDLNL